ncbi:MAG: glycosyltransferase family 2 protein [Acidibrevibacterium sp.]|uniref:glycosyltransferase family 2 protein n=1 Tax=Acidibrevibacterium sp. TaxID=2606776 RepID=UPI003CFE66AC
MAEDPARVVVVIPACEEAGSIAVIVAGCLSFAAPVIVVDDGSRDATSACAAAAGALVLRHPVRRGKGAALETGFAAALAAGAAFVATLDGDGQHRPEDLPRLLTVARRASHRIVIGSRRSSRLPAPRGRRVANRVADFWISWAAGHPVADSQCGFRVYPADLLRALPARRRPRGFAFEAALLIEAARAGYRTIAVDVPALYGGPSQRASHFRPVADVTKIVLVVAARLLARGLSPWSLWRALTLPEERA